MKKTKVEVEHDFYLLKSVLSLEDAEKYCQKFKDPKYSVYVELLDLTSGSEKMSCLGTGYFYYEDKPLGRSQVEIKLDGLRMLENKFRSKYEGKMFRVPLNAINLGSDSHAGLDESIGTLTMYLKGIDFLEEVV